MAHKPQPDSYNDWVDLRISDNYSGPLSFQNAQLKSGKFYKYNNENDELSPQDIDAIVIYNGNPPADICACGRQASATGTEGSVDMIDANEANLICTLYWSCPYTGSNDLEVRNLNTDNYSVTLGDWSPRGPLGTVTVDVS